MSTKCQIILVKDDETLWYYRHSDGYPSSVVPELRKFLEHCKKVDDGWRDLGQLAGWLILIGAHEYHVQYPIVKARPSSPWKVGAFEPCAHREFHGDIQYFYKVDLKEYKLTIADCEPWLDNLKLDDGRNYDTN